MKTSLVKFHRVETIMVEVQRHLYTRQAFVRRLKHPVKDQVEQWKINAVIIMCYCKVVEVLSIFICGKETVQLIWIIISDENYLSLKIIAVI